jgi:hypothetical protein
LQKKHAYETILRLLNEVKPEHCRVRLDGTTSYPKRGTVFSCAYGDFLKFTDEGDSQWKLIPSLKTAKGMKPKDHPSQRDIRAALNSFYIKSEGHVITGQSGYARPAVVARLKLSGDWVDKYPSDNSPGE